MRATCWVPVLGGLTALAVAGCSGDGGPASSWACTPGATQACVCAGRALGGQECASDGSRWLSCDCGGGATANDGGAAGDDGGESNTGNDGGPTGNDGDLGDTGSAASSPEGFVLVSAGTFTMGPAKGESGPNSDAHQHEVTLTRSFYLQETEVTQGQWEALMGNNPSHFVSCGDDCPVENVSWWDALAYANALSTAEGLAACYTLHGCTGTTGVDMTCTGVTVSAPGGKPYLCTGYRLPTAAEWEYAYRAGSTTAFYNGDIVNRHGDDPNLDIIGWYEANAGDKTHPAAQKEPNAWGLYDMAGNVWEWTWDWYGIPPTAAVTDPTGAEAGSDRVNRGGSCRFSALCAHAAWSNPGPPGDHDIDFGFRLARTAP